MANISNTNIGMKIKHDSDKIIQEVFDKCASANEVTGMFQRIHIDPEEIALFHKMYNELDD